MKLANSSCLAMCLMIVHAGCQTWSSGDLSQTIRSGEGAETSQVQAPTSDSDTEPEQAFSVRSAVLATLLPQKPLTSAPPPLANVRAMIAKNDFDAKSQGLDLLTEHLDAYGKENAEEYTTLVHHPHSKVRLAAIKLTAALGHDQALTLLVRATHDSDMTIKRTAIQSLGTAKATSQLVIQGIDARLEELYRDGKTVYQEDATLALLQRRGVSFLPEVISHQQWRVRRQAAVYLQTLPPQPTAQVLEIAGTLINDSNPQVQEAVITAMENWPVEKSGPLYLQAMHSPVFKTRSAALQVLTNELITKEEQLKLVGRPDKELAAELESRWEQTRGELKEVASAVTQDVAADLNQLASATRQTLQAFRQQQISSLELQNAVRELGHHRLPVLLKVSQDQPLPPELYLSLAKVDETFDLLQQFAGATSSSERNSLVSRLEQRHSTQPLPPLALVRLSELTVGEADPFVLLRALHLITDCQHAACEKLALTSLSHTDAQVRSVAADYFCENPSDTAVYTLLDLAKDPSVDAPRAARALSRFNEPASNDVVNQTTELLSHRDAGVQRGAAIALARWNQTAGWAALERMAVSDVESELLNLAAEVASLPKKQTLYLLVSLLEGSNSVRIAAVKSLNELSLHAENIEGLRRRPPAREQLDKVSREEQIRLWQDWAAQS